MQTIAEYHIALAWPAMEGRAESGLGSDGKPCKAGVNATDLSAKAGQCIPTAFARTYGVCAIIVHLCNLHRTITFMATH